MISYKARAKELQPTLYITLGGIVQSLAFTALMFALTNPRNEEIFSFKLANLVFWLKFFIIFEIIIIVWHEYAVGLIYFGWVWTLTDSFIPFMMGGTEFYLISRISYASIASWLFAMCLVCIAGLASYLNQWVKMNRDRDSRDIIAMVERERRQSIYGSLVLIAAFGGLAFQQRGHQHVVIVHVMWQIAIFVVTTTMLVLSERTYSQLRAKLP